MSDSAFRARVQRAADTSRRLGVPQAQVAAALGASQSQISRIFQGRQRRWSRLAEDVCLYLERLAGDNVSAQAVKANVELIAAVQAVWDGSSSHARALSTVIRSLAALGPADEDAIQRARPER